MEALPGRVSTSSAAARTTSESRHAFTNRRAASSRQCRYFASAICGTDPPRFSTCRTRSERRACGGLTVATFRPPHESGKPDFAVVDLTGPFIHRDGNAAPINVRVRTDEYGYGPFIYRVGAVLSMTDDDSQRVAVFASQ